MPDWTEAKLRPYAIVTTKKDGKEKLGIRYVKTLISYDSEYGSYLAVTMENNFNSPNTRNTKIEWVGEDAMFKDKRDAELEIIVRERFND